MRRFLGVSILALSLGLTGAVQGEEWFRLMMDSPIFYQSGEGGNPPDHGGNNPIDIVANAISAGRDHGTIRIDVTVNGIDGTYEVDVADRPPGADWSGSAIIWSNAAVGTYTPTIEVRDADGALVASRELALVVLPALAASVPQSAYEVVVGDELVIKPTVSNLLPPGDVRWSLSPEVDWLELNETTGSIMVDTSAANSLSDLRLTAIDQQDYDDETTSAFAVTVKSAGCEPWTARAVPDANTWTSVAYGAGKFVALSNDGARRLMTSPDGVTWTARTLPTTLQSAWTAVAYGNGLFVAIASATPGGTYPFMTSPDGVTWTPQMSPMPNYWRAIGFGGGRFVAVGGEKVATSADGVNWTTTTVVGVNLFGIAYGNGRFVGVSAGGNQRIAYSTDGTNWTKRTAPKQKSWNTVAFGNGTFVALAYDNDANEAMISPDGVNWAMTSVGASYWRSIAFGSDKFVALGQLAAMESADGTTWQVASGAIGAWSSIAFGDGTFVAVAQEGANRAMTSNCGNVQ